MFSCLWDVGGDDVGWEAGFDVVGVEPGEHLADAAGCQTNASICRAIVDVDGISVFCHGVAGGKDDVADVAGDFVVGFGAEHPTPSAF